MTTTAVAPAYFGLLLAALTLARLALVFPVRRHV
jgi:hypothetical protein